MSGLRFMSCIIPSSSPDPRRSLQSAVVSDARLVAEHCTRLERGIAADVTVTAENCAANDRLLTDAAVGPNARRLDHRMLFHVALLADHTVRSDPRPCLHHHAIVQETGPFDD